MLEQLLKNYDKICEKNEKVMKIDFESKFAYDDDDKYIKMKVKQCADSIITNFITKKIPKEKNLYKCLLVIMLDSVIKGNKKYYPQTFLEECKYLKNG